MNKYKKLIYLENEINKNYNCLCFLTFMINNTKITLNDIQYLTIEQQNELEIEYKTLKIYISKILYNIKNIEKSIMYLNFN